MSCLINIVAQSYAKNVALILKSVLKIIIRIRQFLDNVLVIGTISSVFVFII